MRMKAYKNLTLLLLIPLFSLSGILAEELNLPKIAEKAKSATVSLFAYGDKGELISTGSGFLVNDGALIATNLHVVKGASNIKWKGLNKELTECKGVAAYSEDSDLALLATGMVKSSALILSNSTPVIGEHIAVFGSPRGFDGSLSDGIVSAIRKEQDGKEHIQITAAISPGSSGSPVLNNDAQVVGIATLQFKDAQTLNFAVPSSQLDLLINTWIKDQKVKPFSCLPRILENGFVFSPEGSLYSVTFPATPKLSKATRDSNTYDVASLYINGIGLSASHGILPDVSKEVLMKSIEAGLENERQKGELVDFQSSVSESELGIKATYVGYKVLPVGRLAVRFRQYVIGRSSMRLLTAEPPDRSPSKEVFAFERSLVIKPIKQNTDEINNLTLEDKYELLGELGYTALQLDAYFQKVTGENQKDIRLHEVDALSKGVTQLSFTELSTHPDALAATTSLKDIRKDATNQVETMAIRYGGYSSKEVKEWIAKLQAMHSKNIKKIELIHKLSPTYYIPKTLRINVSKEMKSSKTAQAISEFNSIASRIDPEFAYEIVKWGVLSDIGDISFEDFDNAEWRVTFQLTIGGNKESVPYIKRDENGMPVPVRISTEQKKLATQLKTAAINAKHVMQISSIAEPLTPDFLKLTAHNVLEAIKHDFPESLPFKMDPQTTLTRLGCDYSKMNQDTILWFKTAFYRILDDLVEQGRFKSTHGGNLSTQEKYTIYIEEVKKIALDPNETKYKLNRLIPR